MTLVKFYKLCKNFGKILLGNILINFKFDAVTFVFGGDLEILIVKI